MTERSNLPTSPETAVLAVAQQSSSQQLHRWLGLFVILLICVLSLWLALNPRWVRSFGHWGYAGAFIVSLIASATVVLPAPGLAIVIAMAPALDPVALGIVAGIGSAVGELSGYAAGAGGSALIPENQRHRFDRIEQLIRKHGAWLLALLAAQPLPIFDIAGIVAGILRMNVFTFLLAVAVGKSVKYIILILLSTGSLHLLQQFWNG